LILKKISLINVGVYKGEHIISVEPQPKKPVILFGALNGSGKTTLLEGIQIALYGKSAKTSGRGKKGYEEYLRGLINRSVPKKEGASVSLEFEINIEGKPSQISLTRSWFESGKSIKENCEIYRGDVFDKNASDRSIEFIENIIPSEISNLFFFDGEKIEGLAEPSESKYLIQEGIYSLLGIKTIDNLIKSLLVVEKRKAKQLAVGHEEVSIETEEKDIERLNKDQLKANQNRASMMNELDELHKKNKKNQELMNHSGFALFKERDLLKQDSNHLNLQIEGVKNRMRDISSEALPLIILQDEIAQLRKDVKKTDGHSTRSYSLLEKEFSLMLNNKSVTESDPLKKYTVQRLSEISKNFGEHAYDIEIDQIPTSDELLSLKDNANQLIKEYDLIEKNIAINDQELSAIPDEAKIKPLIQLEVVLAKKISECEFKIKIVDQELHQVEIQLNEVNKTLYKKLKEIGESELGSELDRNILEKSNKSRTTLANFKKALISKHISSIGDEISICYKLLHRKKNEELKFEVSKEDFSLMINDGEHIISASTLSAGERQLLAVSILWALTRISKTKLPALIDTPLARLDGPHRGKLIKNYFPNSSHQVMIFSTDEEITREHLKSLKPFISHDYLISFDEASKSSTIAQGYFPEGVLQ